MKKQNEVLKMEVEKERLIEIIEGLKILRTIRMFIKGTIKKKRSVRLSVKSYS